MLDEKEIQCPYCWESFSILVDPSEGEEQSFVYDCEVCCRPIDVEVIVRGENVKIRAKNKGEN
ncbi:MAG: CPXCG motif-containing cysteine-rich protein [Cryobacterium sp.]|nr:CPXCG motif-containing cysteine-rich protein [Oligoflexia bacterium]